MRRRTLVTLLALAAVIALAAIIPQTPPGRAWLLGRVQSALQASGIALDYGSATGNPWTGVHLDEVSVRAPGVDVRVAALDVGYFLPSLLTGELPLTVTLKGVRGSVDVTQLARSGGGAGFPVTPVLQELKVSDASVTVQQVPYTIPSGAVSDIRIRQRGNALDLQAHLRTADGSADARGVLDLTGPSFDGQVTRADITLARHWFPGASGGTVSGPLHVGADGVRGDFKLQGGSLTAIGLTPANIHGDVQLRYPLITAKVQGDALGGSVQAEGTVNIAARHWEAHGTAAPQLVAAAAWLGRGSLPPADRLALTGTATTTLDVSGWTEVHVSGKARGSGSLAGMSLTALASDYTYDTRRGVTVQATGDVAGGTAVVTVASGPNGTRVDAKAQNMAPLPGQRLDGQLQLQLTAQGAGGNLHLTDHATLPDRHATLSLDAGLNRDGWQGVLQGSDDLGARLEGALALANGTVSGELRAHGLTLAGLTSPVDAGLRADGPVTALPLTLTLGGSSAVTAGMNGASLDADLSGQVHAVLEGTRLTGISGTLGPLTVSGGLDLAPLVGTLAVTLAPTALRGPVTAQLAVVDGTLAVDATGVHPAGTLHVGTVEAGPLALRPGPFTVGPGSTPSTRLEASSADGKVRIALGGGEIRATLAQLAMTAAGVQLTADGTLTMPLARVPTGTAAPTPNRATGALEALRPDLTVRSGAATLRVRPQGGTLAVDVAAPSGSRFGPIALSRDLQLSGEADLGALRASLSGALGDLPVTAALAWPAGGARLEVAAGQEPQRLDAVFTAQGWSATGALPLDPIATALTLPLAGRLEADLHAERVAGNVRYRGSASVDVTAPIEGRLTLTGAGARLEASLRSTGAGVPLQADGTLLPQLALTAQAGPLGPLTIGGQGVHGSGTMPARSLVAGVELGPLPWSVHGTLSPLVMDLALGDGGHVHLRGDRLSGDVRLPLLYGGQALVAELATAGSGPRDEVTGAPQVGLGAGLGALPVAAHLRTADGAALLDATGTPGSLKVEGKLPAAVAAGPLPAFLEPAGTITLNGEASLTGRSSYRVDAHWQAGASAIDATLSGAAGDYRIGAQGGGLSFHASPGSASLTADGAALRPLLASLPTDAVLDGALSHEGGAWTGALHARATTPARLSADLTGQGGGLTGKLEVTDGPLLAEVSGPLLPDPRLQAVVQAYGGAVRLDATTDGTWSDLRVTAALTTSAVDAAPWIGVPARRASITWSPRSGKLAVRGDGLTLNGSVGEIQGSLALPLRVLGADESLSLDVGGSLPRPTFSARLSGGAVHGTLAGNVPNGLDADLTVAASALGPHLGAASRLLAADARVTGHVALDGSWRAALGSALAVGTATLPVHAVVDGQGAGYAGTARLLASPAAPSAAPLAIATLQGRAGDLSVSADLASVDLTRIGALLGVPLDVKATGELTVATAPLTLATRVQADGTLAGRKVTLAGHASAAGGIDLSASYGPVALRATGASGAPLRLDVQGPDGSVQLGGTLDTGRAPRLDLSGSADGAPMTVHAHANPAAGSGALQAQLGGASLDAGVTRSNGTTDLTLRANAPVGSLRALGSGLTGSLATEIRLAQGAVRVHSLQVNSSMGPTPWTLALSGAAYPDAGLAGTLEAPAWKLATEIRAAGPPRRLDLTLKTGQLTITAGLRDATLDHVRADGDTQIRALATPVELLATGLTWRQDGGFSGGASIRTPGRLVGLPGELAATLSGHGALSATATAGPADRPWLHATAQVSSDPWQHRDLQGTVTFDVPLTQLVSTPTSGELRLTGHPSLSGSWAQPSLDGAVALQGAVQARGALRLQGTQGSLTLGGTAVALKATYQGGAWGGNVSLDHVPLAPFDPRLEGASVSLHAELAGGGDRNLQARVSSLELTVPGASLTGSATLGQGVRAALQVRADLSAMTLPGPHLQGLVHGPLVLAAPSLADVRNGTLIAVLDLARVGLAGTGGTVDGTLQLGGSPADPTLSATLHGAGEVHGQLRADARPAQGRLDLHSTLAYRSMATDLALVLQDGRVEARGQARVGNAEAQLSTDSQGRLQVVGASALSGWRATVAGDLGSAQLNGPLSSLGVHAGGTVELAVGAAPWLSGRIQGASIEGIDLGTLSVSSDGPGAPVLLDAPHLHGSLRPTSLAWALHLEAQPLTGGITATGDASGTGLTGDTALTLSGTVASAPVALTLRASNRDMPTLHASGNVLGGQLDLTATLSTGRTWAGRVTLEGARLAGVRGALDGTLGGPAGDPALDGNLTLQGAVGGSARLHASLRRATLEAALQGPAIGGELHLSGALVPTLDLTLSAAGSSGGSMGTARLFETGGALRADGNLQLASGPMLITLAGSGPDTPVGLGLRVRALPGLVFHGELPSEGPLALAKTLSSDGLTFTGAARTRGRLTLRLAPAPQAELQQVELDVGGTTLSASGTLAPNGSHLQGALRLPDDFPVDHVGGAEMPYQLTADGGRITVRSDGALGTLHADIATAAGSGTVQADLHTLDAGGGVGVGSASVALSFDPSAGPSGTVAVNGVQVTRPGLPAVTLAADLQVGGGKVSGNADVKAPHGGVHADGSWGLGGWLPSALAPNAPTGGTLQARVNTFQLASLPTVARLAPHVAGTVSGIVRLRNETAVAQLVSPDFAVDGTALPLDIQLSGPLNDLSANLKLGTSFATATLQASRLKGVLTLRRFPAQVLAEASVGATDIRAEVDGLVRFDVPFADPAASYVRMATERIRLERAGVVTTGNLAFAYNDHAFTLEQASFKGRGTWQAQGTVDANQLDLKLSADNADFGPLLGLVPMFARYGVSANGSFTLEAQGSPTQPDVNLTASGLEVRVAGTHYRVGHADVALKGSALTAVASVVGVAPLGGSLDVHGSAQLTLAPLALRNTDFRFAGSAQVPVFGTVTDLSGGITQPPGSAPQLAVSGKLGNPFTIRGSLAPFDVTLRGQGLDLEARPLFVTSSSVNANVRMRATSKGLALGGELDASEIRMDLATGSSPSSAGSSPTAATGTPGTGATDAGAGSPTTGTQAALRSLVFDKLHLRAPQRVLLDASFGSMEAALDLTLTGTAASPELSGTASALRGSLHFGGRDFTIDRAVATFQPNRGVYPSLDVQAHTSFDKRRVLSGTSGVSFASPRDSNSFTVTLAFSGQVQPTQQGPSPVTFDISPTLTSDATVQTGTDTATSSPRPLSDQELLSLITLGRLEVQPQFAGQAGIGTAVAQSAIDTAVNVLVVNELQNALSKALGLDVVEIRTSPLSSLLDNSGQPFGVSVRVGGYLTPELFASYRLGNVTGSGENYAFTNEVTLTYDLGPLNFDLSGQLSFPDNSTPASAIPQLGVGLRYAFTPAIGLEAGVDLSNVRRQARFGVSFRW